MKNPKYKQFLTFIALLCFALACSCLALYYFSAKPVPAVADTVYEPDIKSIQDRPFNPDLQKELKENEETKKPKERKMESPSYMIQYDDRWRYEPYAGSTMEMSGCGLVAAASFLGYYLDDPEYDAMDLYGEVGDSCLTNGVNDMRKFCQYLEAEYGVEWVDQFWKVEYAEEYLCNGYCLFASIHSKQLVPDGKCYYDGHIVLVYEWDDQGIWVIDPADASVTYPISKGRFEQVFSGEYFYAVR